MRKASAIPKATLGLAILALAAAAVSAPAVQAAKTNLTWWVPANYTWTALRDRFQKDNPNIRVTIIDGTMDKFYTMISAGLMPDVWGNFATPGITADVTRGWVVDLGPYIKRDGKEMGISDFFPGVMAQFKVRGRQYSLPYFNYTDPFWYNTTMYANAGLQPPPLDANDRSWTWDKAVANAIKTTTYNANGTIKQTGLDVGVYPTAVTPTWFHMFNVKLYSDEAMRSAIPQKAYLNTPEMTNALAHIWDLFYKHKVSPYGGSAFSNGRAASSIEPGWAIKWTLLALKKNTWKLAPLPWAASNSGTLWPDGWRISSQSKHKEAAWSLIKYMTSAESMRFVVTDPKGQYLGSPASRRSIFGETLGRDIGKQTGMDPEDVFRVHAQADAVGVVKEGEVVALHTDLFLTFLEPVMTKFWQNKLSPTATAALLQETADKQMPALFKRWVRNQAFSGKE